MEITLVRSDGFLARYNFTYLEIRGILGKGSMTHTNTRHSYHSSQAKSKMLVNILREYNINKIFLSYLGLWPMQNKLVRNLLPICYLVYQMTCYPLTVIMFFFLNKSGNLNLKNVSRFSVVYNAFYK